MRGFAPGIALLCAALSASAPAQRLLISGAGASVGGGGARTIVYDSGRYYVFVHDGASVVYLSTIDGVNFTAPIQATSGAGAAARGGFAVAKGGSGLGLAWTDVSGTTGSVWYREATLGPTLSFGSTSQIVQGTNVGARPVLGYSQGGTPFVSVVNDGAVPAGGCGGPSNQVRPVYYAFDGSSWRPGVYCVNWVNQVSAVPNASVARSGANMLLGWSVAGGLSTSVASSSATLGEPVAVVSNVHLTRTMQLSSIQSAETATDVHHVYGDDQGGISYARQDGTNLLQAAPGLDLTIVAAAGTSPVISRPASSGGCYSIAYVEGTAIRRKTFTNSIATLSAVSTAYTSSLSPAALSIEESAAVAPALTWNDGTSLYFGVAHGGAAPAFAAVPTAVLADGAATATVTVGPFMNACGTPIANGALVTVTASMGTIVDVDADGALPGTQVASSAGSATFTLQAPIVAGTAQIAAMPSAGGPSASGSVAFQGSTPADGGVDAGEFDGGLSVDPDGGFDPSGGPVVLGVSCGCDSSAAPSAFALLWLAAVLAHRRTKRMDAAKANHP